MDGCRSNQAYIDKVMKAYGELDGDLHLVELDRGLNCLTGLGLCLAGNRDLATMSVFVVGFQPGSLAASDGRIQIGDELLEVNGHVLYGRSHLNASAIIKSVTSPRLRFLLLRTADCLDHMAINPVGHLPVEYKDSASTLIPKKAKSLSVDDAQLTDDVTKVSDDGSDETASDTTPPTSNPATCLANGIPASKVEILNEKVDSNEEFSESLHATSSPGKVVEVATVEVHHHIDETVCPSQSSRSKPVLQKCAPVEEMTSEDPMSRLGVCNINQNHNIVTNSLSSPPTCMSSSPAKHTEMSDSTETSPDMSPHHPASTGNMSSVGYDNPMTCRILPGRPTRIDILKGKCGVGLKVIGGSDTLLKPVIVYELFDDGAAAKDDRLIPGDQILEVNGEDLRSASHSRAVRALRHALADSLSLLVLRNDMPFSDSELHDIITVELVKKPGKGLGLSIVGRRNNAGIIIAGIVRGGVAESDGRLQPGDQIVKVNGEDTSCATHEAAAALLKTLMGKVLLTIARLKPGLVATQKAGIGMKKSESVASDCKTANRQIAKRRRMINGCYGSMGCFGGRNKDAVNSSDNVDDGLNSSDNLADVPTD